MPDHQEEPVKKTCAAANSDPNGFAAAGRLPTESSVTTTKIDNNHNNDDEADLMAMAATEGDLKENLPPPKVVVNSPTTPSETAGGCDQETLWQRMMSGWLDCSD